MASVAVGQHGKLSIRQFDGNLSMDETFNLRQCEIAAWGKAGLLLAGEDNVARTRSETDIDHMLHGDGSSNNHNNNLDIAREKYEAFSRNGRLFAAEVAGRIVAVAMGQKEVSSKHDGVRGIAERTHKRVASFAYPLMRHIVENPSNRVYATLTRASVLAPFRRQHVGLVLFDRVLETFPSFYVPTAYGWQENAVGTNFITNDDGLGFHPSPANAPPTLKFKYFGSDQPPVRQSRYAGTSVEAAREHIRGILAQTHSENG